MNITEPTVRRFEFTDLMSNTSYEIAVTAVNRAGTGQESKNFFTTLTDEEEGNNV